ncbi:hypothetical protein F5X68DRAFT_213396 [Plectosphaerella plurivora]|uniref:Heterokaryon incompatibility domain-containing protein n=1 Tax=Plectosphaerella plurivora TaxID=936078 RepID=A0A9P9A7V8_9PEZI|nr:hypothetical protein F5X68DRAFT_213396 [Plectosphaerella plurivora]
MGAIYRSAARVVVWLGPEADGSTRALELVEWHGKHMSVDWKTGSITHFPSEEHPAFDKGKALVLNDRGPALAKLIARPWFTRVWIRQEIFLAKQDRAVVQCGPKTIMWKAFKDVAFWFGQKLVFYNPDVDAQPDINPQARANMNRLQRLGREVPERLFDAITTAVFSQCTDSRDRVYGVLSMTPDEEREALRITPDYTKHFGFVYRDLALAWLSAKKDLEFLMYAYLGFPEYLDQSRPPNSWIPNWTYRGHGIRTTLPNAGGYIPCEARLVGSGTLRTCGVMVTKLAECFSSDASVDTLRGSLENLRTAFEKLESLKSVYTTREERIEALTRLWFRNNFPDRVIPTDTDQTEYMFFHEGRQYIEEAFERDLDLEKDMNEVELRCLNVFMGPLQRGMIGITENGHLARVPKTAEKGDIFCVLPGCPSTLLLRPAPKVEDGKGHAVVGEAYLDGYMNGEALFGTLPEGWSAVWRKYPGEETATPAYLEDGEEVPVWDDPRWISMGFISEKATESATWQEALDRRNTLSVERLKEKGVPLVDIDLV